MISISISGPQRNFTYHIRGPRPSQAEVGAGSSITCAINAPSEDPTFYMEIDGNTWDNLSTESPWREAMLTRTVYANDNGTFETAIEGFIDTFRAEHNNTHIRCSSDIYSGQIELYIQLSKSNQTGITVYYQDTWNLYSYC